MKMPRMGLLGEAFARGTAAIPDSQARLVRTLAIRITLPSPHLPASAQWHYKGLPQAKHDHLYTSLDVFQLSTNDVRKPREATC